MTASSPKPHTIVPIPKPAILITTTMHESASPSFQTTSRLRSNRRSTPVFSSLLGSGSAASLGFFNSLMPRSISHRQRAEIQLEGLLNEPEQSLPAFARRASHHLDDQEWSIDEVSKLLNTQPFIIERLVRALYSPSRRPSSGSIGDEQVKTLNKNQIQKLTRILNSTMDVRALLFFMMLDEADDRYITRAEIIRFYEKYLKNLKTFDNERLQEVISALLQKFHFDQKFRIDFEEFYNIVSKDATLLEVLSQFTVHPTWFIQSKPIHTEKNRLQRFFSNLCWQQTIYEQQKNKLTVDYLKDNLSRLIVLILYLLINLALALYVLIYRIVVVQNHALVVIARIGGMLLNFNCALIIVLMLKQSILLVRTNKVLRKLIPVDDHIDFHKVVGRVIAILSIIHTIAHMANFGRLSDYSWVTYMFTTKPDVGWVGGFAPLSGVILCIILAIMVIFSMQWIRRGGHFQIFYWTHLLYLPFFIFLIIHAERFWKWIVGPLSLFLLEKIYSILTRYSSLSGRTYIHSATIEQSNVISLTIHRPKNFTFRPGDYISINLPRVALYEFHPFTISSAPEETSYLRVHIQASGNWTKQVYQRFKDMSENANQDNPLRVYRADLHPGEVHEQNEMISDADEDANESVLARPRRREPIVVNGPYSSCARYVFDCKHVVLIGGGIGITPYASILSSLMAQFRATRVVCKHCNGINYNTKSLMESRRLRKVDFIWVNRDQKNFEWFLNLLRQFEQEQEYYLASNVNEKRFLDIHLYFTEIKHDENIGNVPLDLITKVWAQVAGQDIFTSLKSKTHLGRPKWDELFGKLISGENASTANDVNVFFCGPSTMAKTIRNHCATYRFRFYEEKF